MALHMSVPIGLREDPRWARLADLVRELAFLDGGNDEAFTLASGKTSRWFFDMKPVMMNPEAGRLVGQLMNMRSDEIGADFIGGLELGAVPLAALVGVMFMVVIGTFAWNSLKILRVVPKTDAFVTSLVTVVTVWYDLAVAVVVGVIVSALAYAWNNARRI